MDSISNKSKADNSHHLEVVVGNHNNKNSNLNPSAQLNSKTTNQTDIKDTNFEYEDKDNEWDIGIGDLIIDLDADIEKSSKTESSFLSPVDNTTTVQQQQQHKKSLTTSKNTSPIEDNFEKGVSKKNIKAKNNTIKMSSVNNSNASKNLSKLSMDHQATLDKGLKMKIKRTKTGKTSESKHEIVKTESNGSVNMDEQNCEKGCSNIVVSASPSSSGKRTNSSHKKDKMKERIHNKEKQEPNQQEIGHISDLNSSNKTTDLHNRLNNAACLSSIDKQQVTEHNSSNTLKNSVMIKQKESLKTQINTIASNTSGMFHNIESKDEKGTTSPPIKRAKCDPKNMVDVCVGTSVGTITEPDCLGPCEPGTSVTLEGIVWHETEGGVLAVNVTWRGKTYVGTLIDCTKHDWAPPRFCDSPTEDMESRIQKSGRSKRGRNSTTSNNELLNFTETRSSVHSKLRNGGSKGRTSRNSSVNSIGGQQTTPSTSPTAFLVPKSDKRRKSKDESPSSSTNGGGSVGINTSSSNSSSSGGTSSNVSNLKKSKNTASPCAVSPVLIECPEQDCSKKYKHANGLKYHQSHAHGTITNTIEDETLLMPPDSPTFQCSNSNTSAEKGTESTVSTFNKCLEPSVDKPISIKSVLQINDVQGNLTASPIIINEESKATNASEESFFDASAKSLDQNDSNLDKNKNTASSSQFGVNPDFEQISNDSIGETALIQPNNLNFFQLNSQNKVPSVKAKKNRKSPVPEQQQQQQQNVIEDQQQQNRSENVRSPAYSDISDDSNAPIDNHLTDKSKSTGLQKIPTEQQTNNSLIIGGYNNLSFYQSPTFLQNPDNQTNKPFNQSNVMNFEYGKQREQNNPLDLIGKLHIAKANQEAANNTQPMGKMMHQHQHQHFPYNLMQGNYPYNMDTPFGMNVNVSNEESKQPPPPSLSGGILTKEEQHQQKDVHNSAPESLRHTLPPKSIKSEGIKEIKVEPTLEQSHSNFYTNLYSRHPLNLPPSREEDIHRRLSASSMKEEQQQQQHISQSQSSSSSSQPSNFQTHKHSKSMSSKSSFSKDMSKGDEKDFKIKQEGQKPTMETQGPPPPPTNQYYLPYIGPGGSPFFPDPSHSIYRNMLVPPYNTPYHLQIARFPSPEDLSRNTKALDLLQQHASQYYNTHKIHELSDRVNHLKSPTSNTKMQTSSVLPSPQSNPAIVGNSSLPNNILNIPNSAGSSLPSKNVNINVNTNEKNSINDSEENKDKNNSNSNENDEDDNLSYNNNNNERNDDNGNNNNSSNDNNTNKSNDNDSSNNSSPSNHTISNANASSQQQQQQLSGANKISTDRNDHPPQQQQQQQQQQQHVGVYPMPMYPAPYVNPAVLASQQSAVTVINPINPFSSAPHK